MKIILKVTLFVLLSLMVVSCSKTDFDSLSDDDALVYLESYVSSTHNDQWPTDVFIEMKGGCGFGDSLSSAAKSKNYDAVWIIRYNYTFAEKPDGTSNGFNYTEDTVTIVKSGSHFWVEPSTECP